ncbi:MAG: type I-E CRISPR-associated protein Cas7/Cse4/CasC [Armatimonadetes bacterium]|nr:type I-E CRISPR-associated protein Cas7/Cse4/CasC [Armatimonadota bacterium]
MLIEIHVLQNHAPSNLNRDQSGSPKECVFGGVKRARISSQCLKRTIRRSDLFRQAMAGHLATRTRRLPELAKYRLIEAGVAEPMAQAAAQRVSGFGTNTGKPRNPNKKTGDYETAQTMFLTDADIQAVVATMQKAVAKAANPKALLDDKTDLQSEARAAGFRPVTVDVALFGRMTTSEAFRDVDAACQVAHALSTHQVSHEFDYFTAVDDLIGQGEEEEDAGADMIGDVEFNSACYYKYLSVDLDGLVDNLTGRSAARRDIPAADTAAARDLAVNAVDALLRAALLTTPTGKQNTFAAHQLPAAVLVEVRPVRTPVSYANAFVSPARPGKGEDLVTDSLRKFETHVQSLTAGFNLPATARFLLAPLPEQEARIPGVETVPDLNTLCARLREVAAHG